MDNDDEMTVVYRVEPLNENEAAFLPQDLPEVVLDGSNMTTDTIMAEPRARTLPNGGIRSSYSESTYSPAVGIFKIFLMPLFFDKTRNCFILILV